MEAFVNYEDLRRFDPHGIHRVEISPSRIFQLLHSSQNGLTSSEVQIRHAELGLNAHEDEDKKGRKILSFLHFMWTPLAWLMEFTALFSITIASGVSEKPHDWQEFVGILMLLLIHSTISYWQESRASNLAKTLMARQALKARVLRDGVWTEGVDASNLVVGDVISIKAGDIVPADALLLDGDDRLKIDQSALTEGPSVFKGRSESVYSGSICQQGEMNAIVYATGIRTLYQKVAHWSDSIDRQGHFQKVVAAIGIFSLVAIFLGFVVEAIVMYAVQKRHYQSGLDNLLVLLIGGIPLDMPTVLHDIMATGWYRLSQQGAITKGMKVIEKMAGMDVLCSDITGTLTLNKLTVNRTSVEVFDEGTVDEVILMAARVARMDSQDAFDAAIIKALPDKEARKGIQETDFFSSNAPEKLTFLTYTDDNGVHRQASKGPPDEILELVADTTAIQERYIATLNRFAEEGLLSIAVASSKVGEPWRFLGLIPLWDPPREDSVATIKTAFEMGLEVKMITGDQLAEAKKMGRHLEIRDHWHTLDALFTADEFRNLHTNALIERAAGFASVSPEHKYEMVRRLQARNHICGITGDGVYDVPALKVADIGIAVTNATDAARDASDIVLTEPGFSVITKAILTSREIFNGMKNYTIYAVSITIRNVLGFMLLAFIWKFDFPPFMMLLMVLLNYGMVMAISKDMVKPSQLPNSWKLHEIFTTGIAFGLYLALVTVFFFGVASETKFFENTFKVDTLHRGSPHYLKKLASAVFLQVSISSHALIFVTRARYWSFIERPRLWFLCLSFFCTQLVATLIAAKAKWGFAAIYGIGWKWAGVIWLFNLASFVLLSAIKFCCTS